MNKEREVVIVLSSEFASMLKDLAGASAVWVVRTPDTERVARAVWDTQTPDQAQTPATGITLFTGTGDAENDLLSVIDTVELHHGLAAGDGAAANVIKVLGAAPTDAIRRALTSLGFGRFTPTEDGFVAHWNPS